MKIMSSNIAQKRYMPKKVWLIWYLSLTLIFLLPIMDNMNNIAGVYSSVLISFIFSLQWGFHFLIGLLVFVTDFVTGRSSFYHIQLTAFYFSVIISFIFYNVGLLIVKFYNQRQISHNKISYYLSGMLFLFIVVPLTCFLTIQFAEMPLSEPPVSLFYDLTELLPLILIFTSIFFLVFLGSCILVFDFYKKAQERGK